MKILKYINLALLLIFSFACKDDSLIEDLPEVTGNVYTELSAINNDAVSRSDWREYMISEAFLGVNTITYQTEQNEITDANYTGPFEYELLTKKSTPTLDYATVIPNTYHYISVQLINQLENNKSIIVNGHYTPNSPTKIDFEFSTDDTITFSARHEDGLEVNNEKLISTGFVFDLRLWFNNVDFASAEQDTIDVELGNGEIVKKPIIYINENRNTALYESVMNEIEFSTFIRPLN
ncbi:hypothetical protein [Flammeovirga sp. SubArs3]|uniref:hypothetical protein n=1 Tax=Flammeovirga sp. SubArs3 TaxID=2995316 RepID=UPI00248B4147|nr:hypothetical protein [Flammeovirga sp. SubArs3]